MVGSCTKQVICHRFNRWSDIYRFEWVKLIIYLKNENKYDSSTPLIQESGCKRQKNSGKQPVPCNWGRSLYTHVVKATPILTKRLAIKCLIGHETTELNWKSAIAKIDVVKCKKNRIFFVHTKKYFYLCIWIVTKNYCLWDRKMLTSTNSDI